MKLNRGPVLLLTIGAALVLVLAVVIIVRMHNGRSTQQAKREAPALQHERIDKAKRAETPRVEAAIEPEAEVVEAVEESAPPIDAAEEIEPTGYSIAGRVVDEKGAGIPDAEVRVLAESLAPSAEQKMRLIRTLKTDETGAFTAKDVPRRSLHLHASKEGYVSRREHRHEESTPTITLHPVPYSPGRDEVAGITLVLRLGLQIVGRVIDEEDQPIPEATVWVRGSGKLLSVETDDLGTFAVSGLLPGEYSFSAAAEGFVTPARYTRGRFSRELFDGSDEEIVIRLERGITVQGHVYYAESGEPAPGTGIVCRKEWAGPGGTVVAVDRADKDGRFELELCLQEKVTVYACRENYVSSEEVVIDPAQGEVPDHVELMLIAGCSISGWILDKETRAPVENVFVRTPAGAIDCASAVARTNETGEFRLTGLLPGRHRVWVSFDYKPTEDQIEVDVAEGEETAGVEILVSRVGEKQIAGRVVDAQGEPVSAAVVKGLVGRLFYGHDIQTTVSDTEGKFSMHPERIAVDGLLATHPDYAHSYVPVSESEIAASTSTPIVITLRESQGRVEGTVHDTAGAPQQGMSVVLRCKEGIGRPDGQWSSTFDLKAEVTDKEGHFCFKSVVDGTYWVSTRFANIEHRSSEFEVKAGQAVTGIELVLVKPGCIAGKVTTPDGKPVEGIGVGMEPLRGGAGWSGTTTDAEGNYRFENVADGEDCYVFPRLRGEQPYTYAGDRQDTKVTCPNEHVDFVLEPVECGALELTVLRRRDQRPVMSFVVQLQPHEGGSWLRTEQDTSADGRLELDTVHVGTYLIRVEADSFVEFTSDPIEIHAGQTTPYTAYLDDSAVIKGVVVRQSDNSPVTFFHLVLKNEAGEAVAPYHEREFNNKDGSFECGENIGPGTYRIMVVADELPVVTTESFMVATGTESVHRIEIPDGITLRGRVVNDSGRPVAEAAIALAVTSEERWSGTRRTTTDQRGDFALTGLGAGQGEMIVTHPDYAERHLEDLVITDDPPMEAVVVTLDEGGRVVGHVRRGARDSARSTIWLRRHRVPGRRETGTNERNEFEFLHVAAGTYSAGVEGTNASYGPFEVVKGEEHEVEFDLSSLGSLSGKINFAGLSEGEVMFRIELERHDPASRQSHSIPTRAAIEEDGSYSVDQLTPGTYRVRVAVYRLTGGRRKELRVRTVPKEVFATVSENSEATANVTVFEEQGR